MESTSLQNVNILIVEDNEVNQTLLRHLFQNWQLNFQIANNGLEAIRELTDKTYDLILMDIQMPQMDGYTAAQQIRKNLGINTPIVAMTAHAMAGEREKCLSYGMDEYISKPIREEQLRKLIAQFVPLKTSLSSKIEIAGPRVSSKYKHIDLAYMKEVSAGNKEYEKDVTMQFIEAIPPELNALENAGRANEREGLRRIAHNLKTTVSVMGLTQALEPYLNEIEYGQDSEHGLKESIEKVIRVCSNALPEAKHYLSSITT